MENPMVPPPAAPAGKMGAPIGRHRSPRDVFRQVAAEIDRQMTPAEKKAIEALQAAGWQVLVYPQMENAYVDTAVRRHRIRGRYDIGLVRQKIRR